MVTASARFLKDSKSQRELLQKEGITRAKEEGKYQGKKPDLAKHEKIRELRKAGISIRKTANIVGCSKTTVINVMGKANHA